VLFWVLTGLASLALVLVVVNAALSVSNRSTQAEVNQRQQFINGNLQLTRVTETLVRTIAAAAYNTKDETLRNLLAQHGITYTITPNAPPAGAAAAGAAVAPYATAPGVAPAPEAPK
jgi:hypothetical protein